MIGEPDFSRKWRRKLNGTKMKRVDLGWEEWKIYKRTTQMEVYS